MAAVAPVADADTAFESVLSPHEWATIGPVAPPPPPAAQLPQGDAKESKTTALRAQDKKDKALALMKNPATPKVGGIGYVRSEPNGRVWHEDDKAEASMAGERPATVAVALKAMAVRLQDAEQPLTADGKKWLEYLCIYKPSVIDTRDMVDISGLNACIAGCNANTTAVVAAARTAGLALDELANVQWMGLRDAEEAFTLVPTLQRYNEQHSTATGTRQVLQTALDAIHAAGQVRTE